MRDATALFRPSAYLSEMKINVYRWHDPERNAVILRWGVTLGEGGIADCVRRVLPGETAFGRTYEELLRTRGSFEADSGAP
jgi:hypothetical protein